MVSVTERLAAQNQIASEFGGCHADQNIFVNLKKCQIEIVDGNRSLPSLALMYRNWQHSQRSQFGTTHPDSSGFSDLRWADPCLTTVLVGEAVEAPPLGLGRQRAHLVNRLEVFDFEHVGDVSELLAGYKAIASRYINAYCIWVAVEHGYFLWCPNDFVSQLPISEWPVLDMDNEFAFCMKARNMTEAAVKLVDTYEKDLRHLRDLVPILKTYNIQDVNRNTEEAADRWSVELEKGRDMMESMGLVDYDEDLI